MSHTPPTGVPTTDPHSVAAPPAIPSEMRALSAREYEIALMLARGDTCREIAPALGLSVKTADSHRLHILKKLDLRHTVALVRLMIRLGVVQP